MKLLRTFSFIFLTVLISCNTEAQNPSIQLTDAYPNLTFQKPLHLTHSGDNTNRIFLVEQTGYIKVFPNDSNVGSSQMNIFLDLSNKISSSAGEEGLLGLAFHPNYSSNGYFYVNYTSPNPLKTIISRFSVNPGNPDKADSLSEYILMTIDQPYANHNGGTVIFGLDGYMYIGMGDGGSGGDPQNYAQNLQSLLGKILRIDINNTSPGKNYAIPVTNPYYNNPSAGREEIYAYGLRNPWKFSQDPVTGLIYAGDVGQNLYEEIDIITSGGNYGWRVMEGFNCFNPPTGCDTTGKILPIKVYNHGQGDCSVSGGYVYRGQRRPELTGAYIYADYCTGKIWMLRYSNGNITADSLLIDSPYFITSFGVDQSNELYIIHQTSPSKIMRFNKNTSIGISGNNNIIPEKYFLEQNYPNPFNSITIVKFQILNAGIASIKVFDISGKEVSTILNNKLNPGTYEIRFDAGDLPSGIYFYMMIADGFRETRRMVIIK
ncbi:MAG: PQQ-dependent sugar dehydrogenase [Ignavibacteria bacterium]|nr:PQQ-dependent sugar dehydrogenase [Ignavibacteria bacterium]